jgi:hypothetical protein
MSPPDGPNRPTTEKPAAYQRANSRDNGELLPNDLAKTLSPRRQTTEAIMHRRYRSDALGDSRIDRAEQVRGAARPTEKALLDELAS